MSDTRLAILARLRHKQLHGYEIKKLLEQDRIEDWARVPIASLYRELNRMTAEGLIEKVGTEVNAGRARSIYRITPRGRAEFLRLLREAWSSPVAVPTALFFCASNLDALPREETIALIKARIQRVEEECDAVQTQAQAYHSRPRARHHVQALYDRFTVHLQAELDWLHMLLGKFEAGEYP